MVNKARYTPQHAAAGLNAKLPQIESWPNQFPGYEIVVDDPDGNQLYLAELNWGHVDQGEGKYQETQVTR